MTSPRSEISNFRGLQDDRLFETCVRERRTLITLDRDFGQVLRFPPAVSSGIVIVEAGPRSSHNALIERIRQLLTVLETDSPDGNLWIVEPGRIRARYSERNPQ